MAESYPAFRSGQKVTGNLLQAALSVTVRKTVDTSRTSLTATADPELQFAVEANAVYQCEGILYVSSNEPSDADDPSDDIKIDWGAPSGSDGSWGAIGPANDTDSDTGNVRLIGTSTVTNSRSFGTDNSSASPLCIHIQALLTTGATAGTYSLNWSRFETVSFSATITLHQDSHLTLTRVA